MEWKWGSENMSNKSLKSINIIQIITSLVLLGAKFIWAPVCSGILTLENGSTAHMKCYYTGQLVMVLGIILLFTSLMASGATKDHSKFQLLIIMIGILLLLAPTSAIIGICSKAKMACHHTAAWMRGCGAVAVLSAIIGLWKGSSQLQVK